MEKTRILVGEYLAVLATVLWVWVSAEAAQPTISRQVTITVACANSPQDQAAIDRALDKLKSGDTLQLTGTCNAAVTIRKEGITLDGGGNGSCGAASGATIKPSDPTDIVVAVRARETTLE